MTLFSRAGRPADRDAASGLQSERKWVSTMAKAELGLKRTCLSCGMRYYDFNKTPIICPGCQTEFDPELVVRSRRGRGAAKADPKAAKPEVAPRKKRLSKTRAARQLLKVKTAQTDSDPKSTL